MEQFFKEVDKYFESGVGLADIENVKELKNQLNTIKESVTEETEEELTEKIEEYNDKLTQIEASISQLSEEKKAEKDASIQLKIDSEEELKKIIDAIVQLIQDEKNIGAAFEKFHGLREQWNSITSKNNKINKGLEKKYAKIVEDFYYHINIYKAIQDHDFKRNQQLKTNLITRLKGMLDLKSSKNMIPQLQQIQREWQSLGPVGKEMREEIWIEYGKLCDDVFNLFLSLKEKDKAEMQVNIDLKEQLITNAKEILASEKKGFKDWKKATDDVIELQKQWKESGLVPHKLKNDFFKRFREILDEFFKEKEKFFENQKAAYSDNKLFRDGLIEEAKKIAAAPIDGGSIKAIIDIQRKWKSSGNVHPKDEQKMWGKFREICDSIFKLRDEEQKEFKKQVNSALSEKDELISKIKNELKLAEIITIITDYTGSWKNSNSSTKKADFTFENAVDSWIENQSDKKEVLSKINEARINSISKLEIEDVNDIKSILKDLKNKVDEEIAQYENNLSFFSNAKSDNPLLAQVNENIAYAKIKSGGYQSLLKVLKK